MNTTDDIAESENLTAYEEFLEKRPRASFWLRASVLLACFFVPFAGSAGASPYPIKDLGTLVGGTKSDAYAINDEGWAVGISNDSTEADHAVVWDPTNNYDIIDLGRGAANAINALGKVAGSLAQPGGASSHAFIWFNYAMLDIGVLPGFTNAYVVGINASGQVVGYCTDATGIKTQRGFIGSTLGLVDLETGTFGSTVKIQPVALNDAGQVIGYYIGADNVNRGFIWDSTDLMRDIRDSGGTYVFVPNAINNSGQVVGTADTDTGFTSAFYWDGGGPMDLGTLGGNSSGATDINDAGQIVGFSEPKGIANLHAFIRDGSPVLKDIGVLPGGSFSIATAINEGGAVVGYSGVLVGDAPEIHAIFWDQDRGLVDLGTLGGDKSFARALNETGQIVGFSSKSDFSSHAFLVDLNVLAPQASQAAAVLTLTELRDDSDDPKDIRSLDKIIKDLSQPEIQALFVDSSHLDPRDGNRLFDVDAKAVGDCLGLIRSNKDAIPDAVLQEIIDDLVITTEVLAQTAVDEAAAALGVPISLALRSANTNTDNTSKATKLLAEARKELDRAESRFSNGKFQEAIKAYGKAWKKAQEVLERR